MAKKAAGCGVSNISFKTKRGKRVSFRGRAGGADDCGKKARRWTAAQKQAQRNIAKVGRHCARVAGRPGTAHNISCVKSEFKKLRAER